MPKTAAQWISEFKAIHNDKYDYSNTVILDSKSPVFIKCKLHGEFSKSPSNHAHKKKAQGCPHCTKLEKTKATIKGHISSFKERHGDK